MVATQFADLTTGYARFDALKKNLEGIFDKVYQMKKYKLDISYYEAKFEEFKKEFKLADDFLQSNKMPFEGMQSDYEAFTLGECNKKLEKLTEEFEENISPIYVIYLLFNNIDEKINNQKYDDIEVVIEQTIKLINQVNSINTHNKIEVTKLFDKAYETIYDALLYEKMFNRHDILDYLNKKNLSSNRENLGNVLRKRVNRLIKNGRLSTDEIDEELLKHINEGLGYDFLSDEFLSTLSKTSLKDKYDDIEEEKRVIRDDITNAIDEHNNQYIKAFNSLDDANKGVSKLRKTRAVIAAKTCAIILVPFLTLGISSLTGTVTSNKIDEYATITRSVNLETGEIIGEASKVYDEKSTTYVATITVYEPWRKNPTGVGYIRSATAYEYIVPEDVEEGYHVTKEDIEGNLKEKYRFNEPKDQLDENDSMTDSVIVVTETYQDKGDVKKSTKYVIPFAVAGFFLGSLLEGLYLYKKDFSLRDFHDVRYDAYIDLKKEKEARKQLRKELEEVKKRAEALRKTKESLEMRNGFSVDALILPEIKEQEQQVKRH